MNSVHQDFRKRVAAACKCCDYYGMCDCAMPAFSGRNWTFSKATRVAFILVPFPGEWTYGFRLESGRVMTLSELLKLPDFKNLRISVIGVFGTDDLNEMKRVKDVGMEKLLNSVSSLTNEPQVLLHNDETSAFRSPEGSKLLKWLEECLKCVSFILALSISLQSIAAKTGLKTNTYRHSCLC